MRLLVVEDEEKVSRFVALELWAERFAVDHAREGRTGLQMALDTSYDLLIVDLMPSGTERNRTHFEASTSQYHGTNHRPDGA